MPNRNDHNLAVAGQKSINDEGRPAFAQCQASKAALWYDNGTLNQMKSTNPDLSTEPLHFSSDEAFVNTVVANGGSLKLDHTSIRLSGWGCSDFSCRGAGVLAMGNADVVLNDAKIITNGATRCATIATTGATLRIDNCRLESHGGPLPPDYVPVIGPGMMEPPAPLGLDGNCRTHLSMDGSKTYINNSYIYAEAWGAVSTDASGGWLYCQVKNSRVHVAGNGYATYADNGCHVEFENCTIQSGNMALIQDGNSSVTFRNTEAVCAGYGMLLHGGMEHLADIGLIRYDGGSLKTARQGILCKSTNVDIYMKGVTLQSELGILLESKITDDRMYFTRRTFGPQCYGVQVTFEDMNLTGDLLMGDPERPQKIHLDHASLIGAIAGNPEVYLHEGSHWTAAADSLVTLCGEAALNQLDAKEQCTIKANRGTGCNLDAGSYTMPSGGTLVVL